MRCQLDGVLRRPDDFLSKYSTQAGVSILEIFVRTCGQVIEIIRSSKMDITSMLKKQDRYPPLSFCSIALQVLSSNPTFYKQTSFIYKGAAHLVHVFENVGS